MNGLPYYKAYPRDFIEGTIGMPFEVKCAYRVILDLIYMQAGNLPDDPRYLSGILGCSVRKWKAVRETLIQAGKLVVIGEFLTNYRALSEIETLTKLQDKQRENRSRPNKIKEIESPRFDHTEPEPEPELEDSSEKTENIINQEPADAGFVGDDRYAFSGQTIKLTGKDLNQWRSSYAHLSLEAELLSLDLWAGEVKAGGGNWFRAVSNSLAKKEREIVSRIHLASIPKAMDRRLAPDPRI